MERKRKNESDSGDSDDELSGDALGASGSLPGEVPPNIKRPRGTGSSEEFRAICLATVASSPQPSCSGLNKQGSSGSMYAGPNLSADLSCGSSSHLASSVQDPRGIKRSIDEVIDPFEFFYQAIPTEMYNRDVPILKDILSINQLTRFTANVACSLYMISNKQAFVNGLEGIWRLCHQADVFSQEARKIRQELFCIFNGKNFLVESLPATTILHGLPQEDFTREAIGIVGELYQRRLVVGGNWLLMRKIGVALIVPREEFPEPGSRPSGIS